ncbi:MAG TPA: methyltransferase domain-containing protein [Actinomycetes bacterium]|nr:methyltransferase domain-containing protein [Actinomycetes bacterium]
MGRGRLGFELLLGQVLDALPAPPATVVDAGGGTGQLAVALAGHGYRVTVVDTSAAMLATCAQRAADAGDEVAGRVATVQGDAADLPGLLGEASQDAAVCHDLLTRVEDQAALLASLAGVLTEAGVLSLGFANRDWLALRAGRRGDHTSALRLVEGGGGHGGLMPRPPTDGGSEAITLDEATQQLDKAGLALVAAYGVGVFAEAGDEDLGRSERQRLVELERLVAGREPYRSSARTLHLIARRRVFRPDLTGDSL